LEKPDLSSLKKHPIFYLLQIGAFVVEGAAVLRTLPQLRLAIGTKKFGIALPIEADPPGI
jgi:hypothetical protein